MIFNSLKSISLKINHLIGSLVLWICLMSCAHYSKDEWKELKSALEDDNVDGVRQALKHQFRHGFMGVYGRHADNQSQFLIRESVTRIQGGRCHTPDLTMMLVEAHAEVGYHEVLVAAKANCYQHLQILLPVVDAQDNELASLPKEWLSSLDPSRPNEDVTKTAEVIEAFLDDACTKRGQKLCHRKKSFKDDFAKVNQRYEDKMAAAAEAQRRDQERTAKEIAERQKALDVERATNAAKYERHNQIARQVKARGATHVIVGLNWGNGCRQQLDESYVCESGLICPSKDYINYVSGLDANMFGGDFNTLSKKCLSYDAAVVNNFVIVVKKPLNEGYIGAIGVKRGVDAVLTNGFGRQVKGATWIEMTDRQAPIN